MRLKDKTALITGGTSGMGRAASELFAEEGCRIIIAGRREKIGKQIASNIKKNGGEAIFFATDVSKKDQVKNLVDSSVDTYKKIDVLFNNAGINRHDNGGPHTEDEDTFDEVIGVNLKGAFLCTKYVVPIMMENEGGSIINNSSVLDSRVTRSSTTSYHVSKGGLAMLSRKTAIEYAQYNIRANTIQPGAIATEMSGITWEELDDPDVINRRKRIQPLKRMGHPMDVAYAALYLASDEAAFVTGASILVDGGTSALYA